VKTNVVAPLDTPDIDRIWVDVAQRCGYRVERGEAAYATTDGRGTILIGTRAVLDADDCLAQLVFHELCHALVQGEANWRVADWGLDNTTDRDDDKEAACLRLQAHWSARHGLRDEMTPTTPWKTYYAALPADVLFPDSTADEEPCRLASAAISLAARTGVDAAVDAGLAATAALLRGAADERKGAGLHPTGFPFAAGLGETCGTCAWIYRGGRGPAVERCRQTTGEVGDGKRTRADLAACVRWEPPVDCLTCGACCREAYHSVSVAVRDPVVWKQPGLVVREGHRFSILRAGDRCAALEAEPVAGPPPRGASAERFHCRIYDDRPRTCREFERGGRHCLVARRRVGLSPSA
jgi:Putative zinc- or iron-chelating domain